MAGPSNARRSTRGLIVALLVGLAAVAPPSVAAQPAAPGAAGAGAALPADASTPAAVPVPPALRARLDVLEHFIGRWQVRLDVLKPQPLAVSYVETYRWMLDRRFVLAEMSEHSRGETALTIATWDPAGDGYPFWIFMSSGAFFPLPAARWDAATRTMHWKSAFGAPVRLDSRCRFTEPALRLCHTVVRDWKGSVLSEQSSRAERRPP